MIEKYTQMEDSFNRFMTLKTKIQHLATIVQNPMELTECEIALWEEEQLQVFRNEFETLVADVKQYYKKKRK